MKAKDLLVKAKFRRQGSKTILQKIVFSVNGLEYTDLPIGPAFLIGAIKFDNADKTVFLIQNDEEIINV
jgi:hypothetical protein